MFKIILFAILFFFFVFNLELLDEILSVFSNLFRKKQHHITQLIIFSKKYTKTNAHFFIKYFSKICWIFLIIILLILIWPTNKIEETKIICEFNLLENHSLIENNCSKTVEKYVSDIVVIQPSRPVLNKDNEIKIILFGDYNDQLTKNIANKILQYNKQNPNQISYSFVPVFENEKTKIMDCMYFINIEQFWPLHNIYMTYEESELKNMSFIFQRLNIDDLNVQSCNEGNLNFEENKYRQELISQAKIFAIPTTFVGDSIFIGDFDLEFELKK